MSACEVCWTRASQDALTRGGSTAGHYRRRLAEQEERPDHDVVTLAEMKEADRG